MIYNDHFWGFNDSGGKNELYGFNKSGKIKYEIELNDAKNKDWESGFQPAGVRYVIMERSLAKFDPHL